MSGVIQDEKGRGFEASAICERLRGQRTVARAEAGEFRDPAAPATIYQRLMNALMNGSDEDVQAVLATASALCDAGMPEQALYTEEFVWTRN